MQNLFVSKDDDFEVKFCVATDENGTIYCDLTEEALKDFLPEDKKYEIKDYKAVFKKPSFGKTIDLYESVFTTDGTNVNFNPIASRYKKMTLLIKSWNLTEKEGTPKEEEIKSLHPAIARIIGVAIDLETGGLLSMA